MSEVQSKKGIYIHYESGTGHLTSTLHDFNEHDTLFQGECSFPKKSLDDAECIQFLRLCTELKLQCRVSCMYLEKASNEATTRNLLSSVRTLILLLNADLSDDVKKLYSIVGDYDYENVRANGIRSQLILVYRCLQRILHHLKKLNVYSFSNWSGTTSRTLIAFIHCFIELRECIRLLPNFSRFCTKGSLFPKSTFTRLIPNEHSTFNSQTGSDVEASTENVVNYTEDDYIEYENLQTRSDNIKQEYFYGRCMAFYMCPSAQHIFNLLGCLMAGYWNSYLSSKRGLTHMVNTFYRSVTSFLSPEERGLAIATLTRTANVEFCKTFWGLIDHRIIYQGSNVILPTMAISHIFDLTPRRLRVPVSYRKDRFSQLWSLGEMDDFISINYPVAHIGPTSISVRLLSRRTRPGTDWAQPDLITSILQTANLTRKPDDFGSASGLIYMDQEMAPSNGTSPSSIPSPSSTGSRFFSSNQRQDSNTLSPYLLFHIHGGGFIALKSQSQDIFLRGWAEQLDCPILSVDYSLAPEAPYPRALEDCLFAYCWAILNLDRLGVQSNARIVICGDSAGGNLALGLCLRLAQLGIVPRPAGALIAYAPILVSFTPSPSRMLSLYDPLLSVGILSRCLLAYAGVDEKLLTTDDCSSVSESSQDSSTSYNPGSLFYRWFRSVWYSPVQDNSNSLLDSKDTTHLSSSGSRILRDATSIPSELLLFGNQSRKMSDVGKDTGASSQPKPHYRSNSTAQTCFNLSESDYESVFSEAQDFQENDLDELVSAGEYQSRSDSPTDSERLCLLNQLETHSVRLPESDLDRVRAIQFAQDPLLSPYLASDCLIRELPPLGIICSNFDPFLDDMLELAKRASSLDVPVDLRILDDLPHAFLNFAPFGPEFQHANRVCLSMLKRLFEGFNVDDLSDVNNSPTV